MAMKDDLERTERILAEQRQKCVQLVEENQQLKEEVRNYRTAVSAVKWLWDRACDQTPFQL